MFRYSRFLTLIFLTGLLMAAIGGPAGASGRRCPKYTPVPPPTEAQRAEDVPDEPVVKVTDAATEDAPIVIDYTHGPSVWWFYTVPTVTHERGAIVEDTKFFNVQVDSEQRLTGLHMKMEWRSPSVEEVDMYVYDEFGDMLAWSESFNQLPRGAPGGGANGGWGIEYVPGLGMPDCAGVTIESAPFWWSGLEPLQLKLWLGPIEWSG